MSSRACLLSTVLLLMSRLAIPQEAAAVKPTIDLAQEIEASLIGPDCSGQLENLTELVGRPDFEEMLHARRRALLLISLAMCTADAGDFVTALGFANRAAATDPESAIAQRIRLTIAMVADSPADAIAAFEAVSQLQPDTLRMLNSTHVGQVVEAAIRSDPSGDSALRVYDVLQRVGWRQPGPSGDDAIRAGHARLLIERGRIDAARERLAPIVDVPTLVEIRADRRFDPLRQDPAFEAQLDLAAGTQQAVVRAQAARDADPRNLRAVHGYVAALMIANRYADALEVVNAALQRLAEDPDALGHDSDGEHWIVSVKGGALYALGRFDEGRTVFQELIRDLEGDWYQASMQMTLADLLVGEGRAQEALAYLPRPDTVSPWGRAWSEAVRVCAGAQVNDDVIATEALAYLRSHPADHDRALPHALLCVGGFDELAEWVTRRLNDPLARSTMLRSLQVVPRTAFDALPFMKTIHEREEALRARADVSQAIESVGRVESIPVRLDGLY